MTLGHLKCPKCKREHRPTPYEVACGGTKTAPHPPVLMRPAVELSGQQELAA